MSLFKRDTPTEEPPLPQIRRLDSAIKQAQRREYGMGFADGILEAFAQIENCSTLVPSGGYTGPLPDELREWITSKRANADQARAAVDKAAK